MEISESKGIVTKCFQLFKFTQYTTTMSVSSTIDVNVDSFRSKWVITIFPMCLDNLEIDNPVNCDVVIELKCIYSNCPTKSLKDLSISSTVRGREDYPKEIKRTCIKTDCWKDVLISRATLQTVFKFSSETTFSFSLIFSVPDSLISTSYDSFKALSENMEKVFQKAEHFDTCLVTSTSSKFFAHAAILDARSNILDSIKRTSVIESQENIKIDDDAQANSTKRIREASLESTSSSTIVGSPMNKRAPLFMVSLEASSNTEDKVFSSPMKSTSVTPKKTPIKTEKGVTPKRKAVIKESPLKSGQTQLTNYFPRSSSLNTNVDSQSLCALSFLSPIGLPAGCSPKKLQSPSNEVKRNFIESPRMKENSVLKSFRDINSPKDKIIRSPCGVRPNLRVQVPKRKLSFDESEEDHHRNISFISLNMSTSVTEEVLNWIYTGVSTRIDILARPLLVAALRHDVKGLAVAAQHQLASTIDINNVTELLFLSYKYKAPLLKTKTLNFALNHAAEVTGLSAWTELSIRHPELMLEFTRSLASRS